MCKAGRRGFTLIELLVVIAIIAILAAMLFPVFARARESARKIQCLSNVKNVAMAMQMYLTDYDRFPPREHRADVIDYMATQPGGATNCIDNVGPETYAWRANPYLRWPVILDEYIKNRDIWRCPSAKLETGATYILPGPDFLANLKATVGQWGGGMGFGPCVWCWPSGWGGSVTDSAAQQMLGVSNSQLSEPTGKRGGELSAFVESISYNEWAVEVKTAQIEDASSYVVCQDGGGVSNAGSPGLAAYPDICCAECSGYYKWDGWPPTAEDACGIESSECAGCWNMHANLDFLKDPKLQEAAARHLGGSNLGFADGHASWIHARQVLAKCADGTLMGLAPYCPSGTRELYTKNCGDPNGYNFLY